MSTGATPSSRTSLVDRSRRLHLCVFGDEQRNDGLIEALVVLRYERDTFLLHDRAQDLEQCYENDVQSTLS